MEVGVGMVLTRDGAGVAPEIDGNKQTNQKMIGSDCGEAMAAKIDGAENEGRNCASSVQKKYF